MTHAEELGIAQNTELFKQGLAIGIFGARHTTGWGIGSIEAQVIAGHERRQIGNHHLMAGVKFGEGDRHPIRVMAMGWLLALPSHLAARAAQMNQKACSCLFAMAAMIMTAMTVMTVTTMAMITGFMLLRLTLTFLCTAMMVVVVTRFIA